MYKTRQLNSRTSIVVDGDEDRKSIAFAFRSEISALFGLLIAQLNLHHFLYDRCGIYVLVNQQAAFESELRGHAPNCAR